MRSSALTGRVQGNRTSNVVPLSAAWRRALGIFDRRYPAANGRPWRKPRNEKATGNISKGR